MSCAGVEQGAITHVPSTKDLLAAVPVDLIVDRQAWRQRAHLVGDSLAVGLEHLADGRFEGPDTPRASFEGPGAITEFASGALDLEVRCAFGPHCTPPVKVPFQKTVRSVKVHTPRESFEGPGAIPEFASGALDVEVRCAPCYALHSFAQSVSPRGRQSKGSDVPGTIPGVTDLYTELATLGEKIVGRCSASHTLSGR